MSIAALEKDGAFLYDEGLGEACLARSSE